MCRVDLDLLGDVGGIAAHETGRAHEDERLGAEVDVLLVFRRVAGDRLVAELRELDADLLRRDLVASVAHHRPVATRRRILACRLLDLSFAIEHQTDRSEKAKENLAWVIDNADAIATKNLARNALAQIVLGEGRPEESADLLEQMVEEPSPNYPQQIILMSLAESYEKAGNLDNIAAGLSDKYESRQDVMKKRC